MLYYQFIIEKIMNFENLGLVEVFVSLFQLCSLSKKESFVVFIGIWEFFIICFLVEMVFNLKF